LIIRLLDNLDDAPLSATAFGLPVFYRRLFATQSRETTHPKYTRPEMNIGSRMIKQQDRFTVQLVSVERIIHDQEHVYVVRSGLARHEGPEDDEASQVPGCRGHAVDPFQTFPNGDAPRVSNPESVKSLPQGRSMHAQR
jgi:hypothetical protein